MILKKTDYCSNCGFFNKTIGYCRMGLGWRKIKDPKHTTCRNRWPLKPERCGTCKYFETVDSDYTSVGICANNKSHTIFVNYYSSCTAHEYQKGKNIMMREEEVPKCVLERDAKDDN